MTDRKAGIGRQGDDLLSRSQHGFDLVQADPTTAALLLREVLDTDERDADPAARVVALWGLGRLAHDSGAIDEALIVYQDAVTIAVDTNLAEVAAEVRVSWSVCLQAAGRTDAALAQLQLAEPELPAARSGRLHMQRGFLMGVLGERTAAIAAYDVALPLLVAAGDDLAATRLISNRAVVQLQLGRIGRARADFLESQRMAERLGQHVLAAGSLHNLAYLDGRLGHFPAALRGFAEARERYALVGSPGRYVGDLDIDECGVLLEAGLAVEAEQMADRVVAAARRTGNTVQLAEALVSLARSRLLIDEATGAEAAAQEAATLFGSSGRSAWSALAGYLGILAVSRQDSARSTSVRRFVRLRAVADRLERHGWISEAAEIRVLTGRYALDAGRTDIARDVLSTAAGARRHPLARVRAEAWYAAALLAQADGNRRGALRALDAGLSSVDAYRATLVASDLRGLAGQLGQPLAELGLRLAFDGGAPLMALRWAERCRAASLGTLSGRTAVEAGDLDELRQARLELTQVQVVDDSGAAQTAVLVDRVAELEATVTRRSRHRDATGGSVREAMDTTVLRQRLGDATLVEFVEVDNGLHAVVVGGGRARLVNLGPTSAVVATGEHLAFSVRRLAHVPPGPAAARHVTALALAAAQLDAALFEPVRSLLGTGPLIVVPTGALHSVLWSALPTARRAHGTTVVPSATWWLRAAAPRRRRAVLLVAGPGIRHADDEVLALRRLYPRAAVLTGRDATVQRVGEAMSTSTLVHIAAHGQFRADNPLFSTLQMHDGPLSVHELESLTAVPDTVILTACSSGRSGVLPGDELLGTSASLMALGVRALAAPLLPIADGAAVTVALGLHRGLRRGSSLATSMAGCVRSADRAGHTDVLAAASSFVCYAASGSGMPSRS